MSALRFERLALAAVLLLFIALGVGYSLAAPPFEKPDEVYHYAFARHLAQGNPLPVQTTEWNGPWLHEGAQAPFYYFLAGRLTAALDQSDFDQLNVQNRFANLGDPLFPGNKNFMLYSARSLPLRGANLAMHVDRWFSLFLGCLTILVIYLTARLAFPAPSRLPLVVILLVACIPQFAFISSSVSNDSLITLASTTTVYWLTRLVARERSQRVAWWEWLVLGVLLGVAALSKLQGLVLIAPIGIVILWLAWERKAWRLPLWAALLVLVPALAIAGWWYWRNFTLYGEWFGAERLLTITGLRTKPLTLRGFIGELDGLRYSFWGLFGWFNIILPAWFYRILDMVTVLALAGGVIGWAGARATAKPHLTGKSPTRVRLLLAMWAAILIGAMLYWSTFATSSQGRLLFPLLNAFAILLVLGLSFWTVNLPRFWRMVSALVLPLSLLACSGYVLGYLLPASYRAPAAVVVLPADVRQAGIVYDNQVELVAVNLPQKRFKPGDTVPITLYLRSDKKLRADFPLFVQLLDENRRAIGNVTSHPGWGRAPTSLWEPGIIYEDRYAVTISEPVDARSPLRAVVYVGFMSPSADTPLPARLSDGTVTSGMIGHVDVVPAAALDNKSLGLVPINVSFEDGLRLIGGRFPSSVEASEPQLAVTLLWEAGQTPSRDYTAFVHLTRTDRDSVSGFDQPPAGTRFPTRYWQPGDRSVCEFVLPLPADLAPGTYQLWAGLYPTGTQGQDRVTVTATDRLALNRSVLLGTVTVR